MLIDAEKLKKDGRLLKDLSKNDQTEELCKIAIEQNPMSLRYVAKRFKSVDLCRRAIEKNGDAIKYAPPEALTPQICKAAIEEKPALLSLLPIEQRTKEVCQIAVYKMPELFAEVPKPVREEIFDETTPYAVLDTVVKTDVTWMRYFPTRPDTVKLFINRIKEKIALSQFLPEEAKSNLSIIQIQKDAKKLSVVGKSYDASTGKFVVNARIDCGFSPLNREQIQLSYNVAIEFETFDSFYEFLEHDLKDANLRDYNFEGVDIRKYQIDGAIIHSAVLKKYGLYDDTFSKTLEKRVLKEVDPSDSEMALDKYTAYLKPIDDEGHDEIDYQRIVFFYVSDLHLDWHVYKHFKGTVTREEAYDYVRKIARKLIESIGTMPWVSMLLIAGDTTCDFETAKVFYKELARVWYRPIYQRFQRFEKSHKIIVVHGNHELQDPWKDIDENMKDYQRFLAQCGIVLIHNAVVYFDNGLTAFKTLSEQEIINLSGTEIREILVDKPIIILGGIGFSGLNKEYNASNMLYGKTFSDVSESTALQRELDESHRFERIYKKIATSIPHNRVIVLTHMKKEDWSEEPYIKNWIYLYGHDHRNYFTLCETHKVYADNQIGRKEKSFGLKHFYIDNDYDAFAYYEDGIHSITKDQYLNFYRGKQIVTQCAKELENIFLIKKNGYHLFLAYVKFSKKSTQKRLYLLNGGRLQKLQQDSIEDLNYYYNNLDAYVKNVHALLERYSIGQKKVAQLIQRIGGSGEIHGCIIDVDKPSTENPYSVFHIFVNPADGKITPYYAENTSWRVVYKDMHTLLEAHRDLKDLKKNYMLLERNLDTSLPVLRYAENMTEWAKDNTVFDTGGYIYRISRIIKSLQYTTEKDIVRIWNEALLNAGIISRIRTAQTSDDLLDDRLIEEVPSL